MIRATPVQIRQSLELVEHMKRIGLRFVPLPAKDDNDFHELVESLHQRLEDIAQRAERQEVKIVSLSDEEITELIRSAGFSMVSAFADRAVIARFARAIERAATIEAMRRCAEICAHQWTRAGTADDCEYVIQEEIAKLEAEK